MLVQRIDPDDEAAFDDWYAILLTTDQERWPDLRGEHGEPGWSRREVHALTSAQDAATEFWCLAAIEESGATLGIGLCEVPQRDNQHSASVDVRVRPDRRRQGVGSAIVAEAERLAHAEGRSVLNSFFEVPTAMVDMHPSIPFALRLGFQATQTGNRRHLAVPDTGERLTSLHDEVARAAVGYHTFTFTAPWSTE